jgi:hypothetical protein
MMISILNFIVAMIPNNNTLVRNGFVMNKHIIMFASIIIVIIRE